ncbi:type I pullulanase [Pseudoneobacillus rhizosphaerae]|uniref:Pullulanase n=1 Tax=Pseudoneobacillus rhizosphaerae TaxID=2880968 RepID=A0A9C7GAG7_9BACI|nr:type I pullulanase [Pseudoneobacillus rhizosphaerae]CAG9608944.1 Pullulanase [Pseudoneobacillus rhizosphaerae]
MISIKRDFYAYLDEMSVITILLPFSYHEGLSSLFFIMIGDQNKPLFIKEKMVLEESIKYICVLPHTVDFGQTYWIIDEHHNQTDLQIGAVIRTSEFDTLFFYNGQDLGVTYQPHYSMVKLWAPTATGVKLKLTSPNGQQEIIEMLREEKGIWKVTEDKDLEGYKYTFLVCVNLRWREAVDPYAVAVTANGAEGVIVNLEKTRTPKPVLPPFEHPVDAIIYETHIRDLTIHPKSGVKHKGKYIGACELKTFSDETGKTGLDYLKELGITHIEFLPVNDFEGVNELGDYSDYNWGYNPLHFNAPEGSYATNPSDPYSRIMELKQLIHSVQQQGIRVILDVVYNHVYNREASSFEKIVPGYYFRHDEFGMPSNGTGVGNDIASERLMVRKFILDSVHFWTQEYDIDGLRFDLMGILDVETMNSIRKLTDQIDPTFLLIGEGWELNTPLLAEKKATIKNQAQLPRIAQFNDQFRDVIKGSTFSLSVKGYAMGGNGNLAQTKMVIAGSISLNEKEKGIFLEPGQSVNYLESHDNHTMWDKFNKIVNGDSEEVLRKYHRLATTILLLSQGIPFLHSGQEFFRTKSGIGNSYNSPDGINQLDWERKQKFIQDVEFIKGVIELRKSHQAFRLRTTSQIRSHLEWLPLKEPLLGYRLKGVKGYGEWSEIIVIFNPLNSCETVQLAPDGLWQMLLNHEKVGRTAFKQLEKNSITIEPISAIVIGKLR